MFSNNEDSLIEILKQRKLFFYKLNLTLEFEAGINTNYFLHYNNDYFITIATSERIKELLECRYKLNNLYEEINMKIWILRIIKVIIGVLVALLVFGYIGLRIPSKNFKVDEIKMQSQIQHNMGIKVPDALREYAAKAFAGDVYEIKNSVVWGKAKLNVKGIWMPARFITYYIPGEGFFRYIEITWFGIPIINGYDLYCGEKADFCMAGQKETGEKIEQGQNLALWAETVWSPTAYFTDERLNWEKTDHDLIELTIPYKDDYDTITISTNEDTGLINAMEAIRYKGQSNDKVLWQIDIIEWNEFNGVLIPSESSAKWVDEKTPWSFWRIEGILYNIEISNEFEEEFKKYINRD